MKAFGKLGAVLLGMAMVATTFAVMMPTDVCAGESPPEFEWKIPAQQWLFQPTGVAVDSSGNVYVTDVQNICVQKFNASGAFLAKWGSSGTGDGQFQNPMGIALDSSANVYVADTDNHRIQKFNTSGTFLTKWGSTGSGDGQFIYPYGIAVTSSGTVYVADYGNDRIQKFNSSGTFLAKWGSTGTGDGQFQYPMGLAVDTSGNVYVADEYNDRIQKFNSTGTFLTKWGSYGTGDGQFNSLYGIAVDPSGNVHVSETGNYRIQKFNSSGTFLTKWQGYGSGDGQFNYPVGIALEPSGNVYVADTGNDRIQKLNSSGTFLTKWGSLGTGNGQFQDPMGVALDSSGNVYVADTGNYRIQKFNSSGTFLTRWGSYGTGDGQFGSPAGVAVDPSGNVYVVDSQDCRVQKFNSSGSFLTKWGRAGSNDGQFSGPYGIAADLSGNVYVADSGYNRVQKFNSSGTFLMKWGSYGSGDGQFQNPMGVALDPSGNVYVTDMYNSRVQKFNTSGGFQTKWGSAGIGENQFSSPGGIAVDPSLNVYVADMGNHRIQKFRFIDRDAPVFGKDSTPINGTTAEPFTFNISITDNIGVRGAYIEYWYGDGTHTNKSMNGTGLYDHTVIIPANSTATLHYIFRANDSAGNWANTTLKNVTILDNDSPLFGVDSTPGIGTTGDSFSFNITVTDNIGIAWTFVEYWYGSENHTNLSMCGTGPFTLSVPLPTSSGQTLHYFFWANDSAGNWANTSRKNVTILDNDPPVFELDSTPGIGTTGDPFTFNITVTDNEVVQWVFVEFWYGAGNHTNISMSGSGPYVHAITVPADSTLTLHYIIAAVDGAGNWTRMTQKDVIISDNDAPDFGTDSTPGAGSTGETLRFNIAVTDNIGVLGAFVEYWSGGGTHRNISMTGSGPYTCEIIIQADSPSRLHYFFAASDSAGNWANDAQKDVMISDNDNPEFGNDSTAGAGTTGDQFTFKVVIWDNIEVKTAFVEYWFGDQSPNNASMTRAGPYTYSIEIPKISTATLHYIFRAMDRAGHWASTSQKDVTITDNDPPVFGTDSTPVAGTTGDIFTFGIAVLDNIGIKEVLVEYWFGTGSHINTSMNGTGPYIQSTTIPANSTMSLHYMFSASDGAGNRALRQSRDVELSDNDLPVFGIDSSPGNGTAGDQFTFNCAVTDNIGVQGVFVEYWFGSKDHSNVGMTGTGPYSYTMTNPAGSASTLHYIFRANDGAGSWSTAAQKDVTISENASSMVKPTVQFTIPTEGQKVFGKLSVSGSSVKGSRDVVRVQLRVDSASWVDAAGNHTWQIAIDTAKLKNGKHTLQARSFDGTVYSELVNRTITVDNWRPAAKNIIPMVEGWMLIALLAVVGAVSVLRRK
jgi:DNA-binding beta-propeller fold protein YncE